MYKITERHKGDLDFIINELKNICIKRNYNDAVIKCNLFLYELSDENEISSVEDFKKFKNSTITLIDELRFTIKTEIRYVLFPIPDIKQDAFEMGKKYMKNFLQWVKPDSNYTEAEVMKILEDELYRLDEIERIVFKINN
ncbi:MAG TPA: hypothetical protein ENI57_06790 [Ignavibacteria bacterium]|nr:hypothetical protein [Ignavibacteria bacterium]